MNSLRKSVIRLVVILYVLVECLGFDGSCCQHGCINTLGGIRCICRRGFRLVNRCQCRDFNECTVRNGMCQQRCINAFGSYRCECANGYVRALGNPRRCVDLDECKMGISGCSQGCQNTVGSFRCFCRRTGYVLDSDQRSCKVSQIFTALPTKSPEIIEDTSIAHRKDLQGIQACPPGYIGPGCRMTCDDCQNGARCDIRIGQCLCSPGWTGILCNDPCPGERFGKDCRFKCLCKNDAQCNKVTGACSCRPGFLGDLCDETCPTGFYGEGCKQKCTCVHMEPCHPVTGTCQCDPGFFGAHCSKGCPSGSFGAACREKCKCLADHTERCDPKDGTCDCKPGYLGKHCSNKCPDGTYGKYCLRRCNCPEAVRCDHVHGKCDVTCPAGLTGPNCQKVGAFLQLRPVGVIHFHMR